MIDTVGKRGGIGEQIRCVVSVSMLTEGWDANNVTHILGVRAFGSQLLCEQVVGRGLRRVSYDINPDTKMLNAEYADVYGIPFSLIPFKGKSKDDEKKSDPVYHSVYAVPERANYEIRLPNVESYVYALRDKGITCDVDKLEGLILDKEPVTVYLSPTRGYQDDATAVEDTGDFIPQTREEYYKTVRPQQVIFRLSQIILDDLAQGAEGDERAKIKFLARHHLFPEILKIVRQYVKKKVTFKEGVDFRELALERYAQLLRVRIRDGILPVVANGKNKLLPVLNSFKPYSTTADVNYQTCRELSALRADFS
jgi:type III restriction enzyme